jgi:predicted metal-dependent phosphoesterase TrpH
VGRREAMQGITAPQSHYVLEHLVTSGRVKQKLVVEILDGLKDERRSLEQRLVELRKLDGKVRVSHNGTKRQRQQGVYLSTLRHLNKRDQHKVKMALKREGIEAALRLGKSL